MTETTPRLGFPLLAAGQAQKELTHNEALLLTDFATFPVVENDNLSTPPPNPQNGQCWIVAASPVGAWVGKADQIACWTLGGWRYINPRIGFAVYDRSSEMTFHFTSGGWIKGSVNAAVYNVDGLKVVSARQPGISDPAGGATPDAEARVAIGAILQAMRNHGLIAP